MVRWTYLGRVRKPLCLLRPPVNDGLSETRLIDPLLLNTVLALRTSVRPVREVVRGSAQHLAGWERRERDVEELPTCMISLATSGRGRV